MNKRLMFLRRVIASTIKEKLKEIGFNVNLLQTFETADETILRRIDGSKIEALEEAVRNTDKAYYRLLGTGVITFTLGMCWIALIINIRGF